jgi:hypothetical protein
MGKIKIILFALLIVAVPLFAFASTSYAGSFHSGDNVTINKNEVVDHTLFIAGNNVEVDGTVKGDVFCAGQNVTINATVEGDVICAGMNINIGGTVAGNVRAAGQVVTLSATVGHNASLAGNTVTTESNSNVNSDLQAVGNTLTLNGTTSRDVDIAGKMVAIDGFIGRDLQTTTDNLQLSSNSKVGGSLTYYSHNQLQRSDGSVVNGTVTQKQPQAQETQPMNPIPIMILSFITLLVLAFALLALFPRQLRQLTDMALTSPGTTALVGLAACVAVPIVVIASLITVIGAFFGIILLFIWIIVMMLSSVFASYYAGRLVFMRSSQHPFIIMLAGVVIVSALIMIPVINILTVIAIALFGSGMVVRQLFSHASAPRYESVTHPTKIKRR